MSWENEAGKKWNQYDPLKKMREHNERVETWARRRVEQYYETRRNNQLQTVPVSNVDPVERKFPEIIRELFVKIRRARGEFRLVHFTLQLGRLRIEFSRAKGSTEQK